MAFAQVERALREVGAGRMVVLVDDESRENEGDLCMAADAVRPEDINFMATHGRGLICVTLTAERLEALQIPMMVPNNTSSFGTAFTVSIEARTGVTTGISAADRARTIAVAVADGAAPADLARPGHIFPLRARPGGVLCRDGQTEGSVDLARLAGRRPAGAICEILREDGTMMRLSELRKFAGQHGLCVVSVADLIAYRLASERLVVLRAACTVMHPQWGELRLSAFETTFDNEAHLLVERGPAHGVSQVALGAWPQAGQALAVDGGMAAGLEALLAPMAGLWRAPSAAAVLLAGDVAGGAKALWTQLAQAPQGNAPLAPRAEAAAPHRPASGRDPSEVAGTTSYARRLHGVAAALLRAVGRLDVQLAAGAGAMLGQDLAAAGLRLHAGAAWPPGDEASAERASRAPAAGRRPKVQPHRGGAS